MVEDFEAARRWLRKGLLEGLGDFTMLELRSAALYTTAWNPWTPVETLDKKRGRRFKKA
jgi:hypothetical protein